MLEEPHSESDQIEEAISNKLHKSRYLVKVIL